MMRGKLVLAAGLCAEVAFALPLLVSCSPRRQTDDTAELEAELGRQSAETRKGLEEAIRRQFAELVTRLEKITEKQNQFMQRNREVLAQVGASEAQLARDLREAKAKLQEHELGIAKADSDREEAQRMTRAGLSHLQDKEKTLQEILDELEETRQISRQTGRDQRPGRSDRR